MSASDDHDIDWHDLQHAFALGAPVLVLGPGCHRIGFDEGEEWQRVRARVAAVRRATDEQTQRFLDKLWTERLSDRTRANGTASKLPREQDIGGQVKPVLACEAARVALAADVLEALAACTRYLGAIVEGGGVPVIDWQRLTYEPRIEEGAEAGEARGDARGALGKAVELVGAIYAANEGKLSAQQSKLLATRGLDAAAIPKDEWDIVKIAAVRESLKAFLETRFDRDRRVSGANVEWLGDLFWHLVVIGSAVPLSQDEVDFYVNLHTGQGASERRFSRPHPGEYRGPEDSWKTLTEDLQDLLSSYDSGLKARRRDWTRPREAFALTMAASLAESWRVAQDEHEDSPRLTIALVSDYDLMFERALMSVLEEDEGFHVLVPVAVAVGDGAALDWAFGTYDGDAARVERPTRWQRFATAPSIGTEAPRGPIVVKLVGSPNHDAPKAAELGITPSADVDTVALFSEHDSVQAIMALLKTLEEGSGNLPGNLLGSEGLTWDGRSWLFFGHRFSDWLPRLQLLVTALMLARSQGTGFKRLAKYRIAIGRSFDWPERALLDALPVDWRHADLRDIPRYVDVRLRKGLKQSERRALKEFCDNVRAAVDLDSDGDYGDDE